MRYVYDITPWDDPKDGAVLVRLTKDDQLQKGSGIRVELFGLGSGILVVNKNHPDVTAANFAPGNYVRVYDLDISSDTALFGFFLDERFFQVLSEDEEHGQVQRYGGPGVMTVFGRVVWDNTNYVNFGNDLQFGPRADGRWWWYQDQYGDILKRAIDEAQDSDRPGFATLIPWVTYDFTSTNDSAGDPWDTFDGSYSITVGENYLDSFQGLINNGLTLQMTPEFLLQAFQVGGFGRDLTSSVYAPDKVLFTSYFVEGLDANIVSNLPRRSRPSIPATRALVRGESADPTTMQHATLAGDVGREIFLSKPGVYAPSVLVEAGEKALGLRSDAADTPVFRHRPGQNALLGLYSPFPPVDVSLENMFGRLYPTATNASPFNQDSTDGWVQAASGGLGDPDHTHQLSTSDGSGGLNPSPDNWSGLPKSVLGAKLAYVLPGAVDFTGTRFRGQIRGRHKYGIGIGSQWSQMQTTVRILNPDGSFKATLLDLHEPVAADSEYLSNEGNSSGTPPMKNIMVPADALWLDEFGAALASETADAGDILHIELGVWHLSGQDGPGAGYTFNINADEGSDLPAGDQTQTTAGNSWFEFWGPSTATAYDYSYWVGDLVTIATGTGVGDYDYENKRVYAINVELRDSGWWPVPELGPITDEEGFGLGGSLSAPSGGGGGGGVSTTSEAPATLKRMMTNKSGGALVHGDVVVVDADNDDAVETTTVAGETRLVGVVQEDIAVDADGWVALAGFVEYVNVTASVTRGHYATTSTTVKKAVSSATRVTGAFLQFVTGGTTPSAILFGPPDSAAGTSSSVVVDHGAMGGAETFDFTAGSDHEGTLDANLTITLTGATDGERAWMTLKLVDDGGGPYTITWPGSVVFPGGVEPEPPAASEVLVVTVFSDDGGTTWYGSYPGVPDVGTALEVEDDETTTTVSGVVTLQFEADDFDVIDVGSGVAKVNLTGGILPLTGVVNGEPVLLWDENDSLIGDS